MEIKELEICKKHLENITKIIDKLYATTSVNVEAQSISDFLKEVSKVPDDILIDFIKEQNIFGKCVFHYKLPIETRIKKEFSDASDVSLEDRLTFWEDYMVKLKELNLGTEENYNKKILMACMLHVPLKDLSIAKTENTTNEETAKNSETNEDTETKESDV